MLRYLLPGISDCTIIEQFDYAVINQDEGVDGHVRKIRVICFISIRLKCVVMSYGCMSMITRTWVMVLKEGSVCAEREMQIVIKHTVPVD